MGPRIRPANHWKVSSLVVKKKGLQNTKRIMTITPKIPINRERATMGSSKAIIVKLQARFKYEKNTRPKYAKIKASQQKPII